MADLARIQSLMKDAVIGGDTSKDRFIDLTDAIDSGAFETADIIQIHSNNYKQSLIDHLLEVFPITKAFVGEMFLKTAFINFIKDKPPHTPQLSMYGDSFPGYFEGLKAAADVIYVADIAKLEWSIQSLLNRPTDTLVTRDNVSEGKALRMANSCEIIESEYPLMNLWMAGNGQIAPNAIHLEQGGQTVAIARTISGGVDLYGLTAEELSYLRALPNASPEEFGVDLSTLTARHLVALSQCSKDHL